MCIISKGSDFMTVQQQVCARIIDMSDEGALFINQVINNMNPSFFSKKEKSEVKNNTVDVSKRIGFAKGKMGNSDNFDKLNEDIANMFEGVNV